MLGIKLILTNPELLILSIRTSGGRSYPSGWDVADYVTNLRYFLTSSLIFVTPLVSLATNGMATNSFSSGISFMGVYISSIYSVVRGGISSCSPPTTIVYSILGRFCTTISYSISSSELVALFEVDFEVLFEESYSTAVSSSSSYVTISIIPSVLALMKIGISIICYSS